MNLRLADCATATATPERQQSNTSLDAAWSWFDTRMWVLFGLDNANSGSRSDAFTVSGHVDSLARCLHASDV